MPVFRFPEMRRGGEGLRRLCSYIITVKLPDPESDSTAPQPVKAGTTANAARAAARNQKRFFSTFSFSP